MSHTNNAITRRLGHLTRQWTAFANSEEKMTAVWSIKEDELDMIEAFYEVEKTEHGKTEDVFLKFSSPFIDGKKYAFALSEELDQIVSDSAEDLKNVGLNPDDWESPAVQKSGALTFLKTLNAFRQFIGIEGNLVAYLSPAKNADIPLWTDWVLQCNTYNVVNLKLMLVQLEDQPVFQNILKRAPKRSQTLIPDLKMDAAMTELAAQGDPYNPATKFRKLYVALMQAAGKSDLPEAKRLSREAIKLTKKYQMTFMEATVHMALGGVYISNKKKKDGLINYDQAIQILENEHEQPELAKQQLVIAYLSKGMALFIAKKYELAAEAYDKAGLIANQVENHFLAMDAWRMAGTSYVKHGYSKDAYACLKKSLKVGMKIEDKMRRDSTMPFAAMELYKLENAKGRIELDKLMKSAIGDDWQDLASTKNQMKVNP